MKPAADSGGNDFPEKGEKVLSPGKLPTNRRQKKVSIPESKRLLLLTEAACREMNNQPVTPRGLEPDSVSAISDKGLRQSESGAHAKYNAADAGPTQTGLNESEADNVTGKGFDPQQTAELRLLELAWPSLTQEARKSILSIIAKASQRKRS